MITSPNVETPPGVVPSPATSSPALDEQQQHIQHKARKKQRKLERLLNFLGWCEGCRSYGNSV